MWVQAVLEVWGASLATFMETCTHFSLMSARMLQGYAPLGPKDLEGGCADASTLIHPAAAEHGPKAASLTTPSSCETQVRSKGSLGMLPNAHAHILFHCTANDFAIKDRQRQICTLACNTLWLSLHHVAKMLRHCICLFQALHASR